MGSCAAVLPRSGLLARDNFRVARNPPRIGRKRHWGLEASEKRTSGPFLRIHFYSMGIAHPLVVLFIHVHTYVRSWLKLIEANSTVTPP